MPKDQEHEDAVKLPEELVSVDQLVSPAPGLIAQMTGILTTKRYKYATVYVDQASRLGYVHLQRSSDAEETVQGKVAFEQYMQSLGLVVKGYQADNGIFRANKWQHACKERGQSLTFTGVNAHHQNGHAERRIRELQDAARAMLIHANKQWPRCVTTNLWPYAMKMASDAFNNTPCFQHEEYKTPLQVASASVVNINKKHFHTFGCPVYVLDNALQENKPFGKWNIRSKVGIYIGQSPSHNKRVALVLDRKTGLVSPQYHVQFDDDFSSVRQDTFDSDWMIKAGFVTKDEDERENRPKDRTPLEIPGLNRVQIPTPAQTSVNPAKRKEAGKDQSGKATENKKLRRSLRLQTGSDSIQELLSMQVKIASRDESEIQGEIFAQPAISNELSDNDQLIAMKASTDPDIMYLHQALRQPDKIKFIEAMKKEVQDQMDNGNYTVVERAKVPQGKSILPAVWQMRRKRDIKTQAVKKYKARLNIDNSRMKKGIHYDQTYSPVASWNSIRLVLSLIAAFGWHTQQIDYVLAFPQAPVEKEIYMEVPKGFEVDGDCVLRLNRNVYGQKQAGRVWNKYLEDKLVNEVGFTKSKVDECVYYRGSTIYILYTDDSILAGPSKSEINQIISDIEKTGLNITREGNIQDFLGINIERKSDRIILSQPHLITQILKDLRMDDDSVKIKDTPSMISKILTRGVDENEFDKSFHYRSIIGKLNYLEKGTRSDISYITHQCARYTENPKTSHAKAIRWLARYLKGTRNKGFEMKPDLTKGVEVYVDADFCGNWDKKDSLHRDTARSRHGYMIKFLGCPIVWKSQLQHEIALSSTESEYTGLSYALREAIPIMQLVDEMRDNGFIPNKVKPSINCTVYEDNTGALEMANIHKYRPRTKHLNVKLHHFRQYVNDGTIRINDIDTKDQEADYLTKPVDHQTLIKLRKRVMGW